jgi:hypothetical protein
LSPVRITREASHVYGKSPQVGEEQAGTFKIEAERLPYGQEREGLERKARQLKIASHLNQWSELVPLV